MSRYKEIMHKIVKVEDVIKQMGCKGPEVMKSIEAEDIQNAVSKLISESMTKCNMDSITTF